MVAVLRTGSSVHQTYQPKSRGGHRKLSCMRFARRGHQPSTSPIWPYIHCHPPQPEEIQSIAQGHTEETAPALPIGHRSSCTRTHRPDAGTGADASEGERSLEYFIPQRRRRLPQPNAIGKHIPHRRASEADATGTHTGDLWEEKILCLAAVGDAELDITS